MAVLFGVLIGGELLGRRRRGVVVVVAVAAIAALWRDGHQLVGTDAPIERDERRLASLPSSSSSLLLLLLGLLLGLLVQPLPPPLLLLRLRVDLVLKLLLLLLLQELLLSPVHGASRAPLDATPARADGRLCIMSSSRGQDGAAHGPPRRPLARAARGGRSAR